MPFARRGVHVHPSRVGTAPPVQRHNCRPSVACRRSAARRRAPNVDADFVKRNHALCMSMPAMPQASQFLL
eukprot:11165977-Lingulodinium_polyedra.AAC.1